MEVSLDKIRKSWKSLEGYHTQVYFAPEAVAAYQQAGLDFILGYFASRSAPMGKVSDKVVASVFYVFKPELVSMAIPKAWDIIDPDKLTEIRYDAADKALRRILGDSIDSKDILIAAEITKKIALTATDNFAGRPLFAGHCNIAWPNIPHMVLFHAQTLIREFRGDGHMLALVTHGIKPLEALILDAAESNDVSVGFLKSTRGWSEDEWNATENELTEREIILKNDGKLSLTNKGQTLKTSIETLTDNLSSVAYSKITDEELNTLINVGKQFSEILSQANSFLKQG